MCYGAEESHNEMHGQQDHQHQPTSLRLKGNNEIQEGEEDPR